MSPSTETPVPCPCGCTVFELVPRAGLLYDRLNPQAGVIRTIPMTGYRCVDCGEYLNPKKRIQQIVTSIET